MERSVNEELAEVLKNNKVGYLTLSQLKGELPASLRNRLKVTKSTTGAQIGKALQDHMGGALMQKGKYIALKQTDESLLLCVMRKNNWKFPAMNNVPFKKDEFFNVLNQLLEKDAIRVKKVNKERKIILFAPVGEPSPQPSSPNPEKEFKAAYEALERGKGYVRIYEIRRHLRWSVQDFDRMLIRFRDAGKIQLLSSATDTFTKEDISDSFIDDRGLNKYLIMWSQ